MRAKRVMSANLPRTKIEGNRYHVDVLDPVFKNIVRRVLSISRALLPAHVVYVHK